MLKLPEKYLGQGIHGAGKLKEEYQKDLGVPELYDFYQPKDALRG